MPRYRYQAVDAQGQPVSGEVEAAGPEQALASLGADGLVARPHDLEEIVMPTARTERADRAERAEEATSKTDSGGRRVSSGEAAEFAGDLADVVKADMPLGPGLRAMADELPRHRFSALLRSVAGRTDAGVPLETAIGDLGDRLPSHVRGVILAGARSGRLAEVLEKFVAIHRERAELTWRIRMSLAYPTLMIGGVVALFLFFSLMIVPGFAKIYQDFEADLPAATVACIWMGTTGARIAIVVGSVLILGLVPLVLLRKPVWLERVLYDVPVLGPMWRWQGLVEFSHLMEILLAHQVPLPEALRLTADGLRGADLAAACRKSAARIEAGDTLSDCMAQWWAFPPTLKPFVDSSAESSRPEEAFRAAAEMFRQRISLDMTLWEIVVPPAILVAVGCSIGFMVIALFMPLIGLFQTLT